VDARALGNQDLGLLLTNRRPHRTLPPPEALDHLRRADPVLREVIDRLGPIEITAEPDLWWSLVDAIVSQQVSVYAAAAIVGRVAALGASGRPTPAEVAAADEETLCGAGLSRPKVKYIKDLASRWVDGSLRHGLIPSMSDEEVIAELTRVKGIGVWTAEMILIFTLHRPDVLPVDDLGIRAAAQQLYGLPQRPGRDELLRIGEPWRPWRTLASRYLWRSLGKTPVVTPDDPAAAKLSP
jgi:DNA-3-methyladenine glycosylase II